MAQNLKLSYIQKYGHEEDFEYACTTCKEDNHHVEAMHYCAECNKYLCQKCCVQHDRFTTGHDVLGKSDKQNWGKHHSTVSEQPTQKCANHPDEKVTMFCKKHNALCCHVCVALEHRNCSELMYILSVCKDVSNSDEFITAQVDIADVIKILDDLVDEQKELLDKLKKSETDFRSSMNALRRTIDDAFDKLDEQVTDHLNTINDTENTDIAEKIRTCDRLREIANHLQQKMEVNVSSNEAQAFIDMKLCKAELQASIEPELWKFVDQICKITTMEVSPDLSEVLSYISNLCTFKEVLYPSQVSEVMAARDWNLKPKQFSCQNKREHKAGSSLSHEGRCLFSACKLPNQDLIVVDNWTQTLHLLDKSYQIMQHFKLEGYPRSACIIEEEVMVSLSSSSIQFLSVANEEIAPSKSRLVLNHDCYGLASNSSYLYVSDYANSVFIYRHNGDFVNRIEKNDSGGDIFSKTRHIATGNGERVYVADLDKGLVTLDIHGKFLNTLCNSSLYGACGVCAGINGSVFVSGSNSIVAVDAKGENVLYTLLASNLTYPSSVCFDSISNELVMTNFESDYVTVYDIVKDDE